MCAIAAIALYTTLRRRGTTRQLAGAIITCVVSALLLLPAIVWYNLRFSTVLAALSVSEVALMLVYVALCGFCVPLCATMIYCLFTQPRTSNTSVHIPRQQRHAQASTRESNGRPAPPRHQPGMIAPYVYSEDAPWGWLVYCSGRFRGQRLALKRTVVTIGRGEDNDIWLDDDLASRHHAELAWDQGRIYITDCDSLNGVLLNGQRIHKTAIIEHNADVEIGTHRFLFEKADPSQVGQQDDPLAHHIWRSAPDQASSETNLPATLPLNDANAPLPTPPPRSIGGPMPLRLPSKQKQQ
jgi:hypothetical protein